MRTALVSDVHGNAVALDAVLADLERAGADQVVCLGDLVQGGPEPSRTVGVVRARGWPTVLGNADAFLLDPATAEASPEPVTERQLAMRRWSVERLSPDDLGWLGSLPLTVEVDLGHGRTLLGCHASPRSYDDLLFPTTPEDEFRALLDGVDADLVAGGHVHLPFVRRRGRTLFVNPGSAGLSYDHEQDERDFGLDPWAAYALVTTDGDALAVELRRVPLDVDAVVTAIRESGQPHADDAAEQWLRGRARVV